MSTLPVISVLTPTFNRADTFLGETIQRIQNQRERGFTHEHIIVDNASSDNTEQVVRSFMETDPRIKYIRNKENLWASGALNIAFEHSIGEIIVPFDDDDIMPELSLQVRFDAMKDPKVQWSSGHAIYIDNDRKLRGLDSKVFEYSSNALPFLDDNYELKDPERFFLSFFKNWMICGGTVTIRRHCIEEVGGWDGTFTAAQDTEMWTKLAAKHYHYKLLTDYLFFYRSHEDQSSNRNSKNGVWKELKQRLREKHGITDTMIEQAGV